MRVRSFPLNHTGGCLGYCLEKDGRKIVYATDNELEIQTGDVFPDLDDSGPLRRAPEDLVEVVAGPIFLIIDAQYDEKEYMTQAEMGAFLLLLRDRSGHPGQGEKPGPFSSRSGKHRQGHRRDGPVLPQTRRAAWRRIDHFRRAGRRGV